MSQTTRSSAARHARTRSDRTSVNATNNSPRRRVLLTRSVQKNLSEPRPPGKVSTGRMACDLCAPHASPPHSRWRRSRYLPCIAPSLPTTHQCVELRAGAEDFPLIPGCGPSRLAAGPTRLPLQTPCARNAHGVVGCSAFLAARVFLTHAAAKEQVMSFIGASRNKARSCPNRLPLPPSPGRSLSHHVQPPCFLTPVFCGSPRCSHSCRFRSPPCGAASRRGLFLGL